MATQTPTQKVTEALGGGHAVNTTDGGIYWTPSAEEDTKHLWEHDHPYSGPEGMYHANGYENRAYVYEYDGWNDFAMRGEFGPSAALDIDMNWLYRWDWTVGHDEDDGSVISELVLFFLIPRRGVLSHTRIINMTPEDEPAVREFLATYADYMATMWSPFLTTKEA